jgi:DNA repair exonuclease SbcCD nuclease subunit
MAKVALITDTHFGARNDSEVLANHFAKFYEEVFFLYLKENGIKEIVHLGDAFDRRKYINFNSLARCKKYFYDNIIKNDIILHQIVGNHDTYFKNTNEVNSADLLLGEYRDQVFVYDKPREVWLGNTNEDGTKVVFMPWICADNFDDAMNLIDNSDATVLMGHLELSGFEMYRGAVHVGGMTAETFAKFDVVMSGHFHHKSSRGNIHYLGCPYEMTWSDYGDQKGFHIFDTETTELTFVPNPLALFKKIQYNDIKWKDAEQVNAFDFSDLTDTFVKVIVINKNNPYWFDLFMNKVEKANPAHIQIVDDNLNLDMVDDEEILENLDDTMTILHKSIDGLQLDVDKSKLDNLFKSLYNEAINLA